MIMARGGDTRVELQHAMDQVSRTRQARRIRPKLGDRGGSGRQIGLGASANHGGRGGSSGQYKGGYDTSGDGPLVAGGVRLVRVIDPALANRELLFGVGHAQKHLTLKDRYVSRAAM